MYDVIGDVHGQFLKLVVLLLRLGYRKRDGAFRHPEGRVAVFVGDLIDRGPLQEEVLLTVRSMVEAGSGLCVMGNHEWNAIGYATLSKDGVNHLRRRTPNRLKQHGEFLDQFGLDSPRHREWVEWFKTLPVALDLGGIRVVHAWWSAPRIAHIQANSKDGRLTEEFLLESFDKKSAAYAAMEPVTKGPEVKLPGGHSFVDHEGARRGEIRLRWWDEEADNYRAAAMVPSAQVENLPTDALPASVELGVQGSTPLFIGHYWLSGTPTVQGPRLVVLDYGAGLKGPLVAYRWSGETELRQENLVAVGEGPV